jgi:hypothetical protein
MGDRRGHGSRARSVRGARALAVLVGAFTLLGLALPSASGSSATWSGSTVSDAPHSAQNGSGGSDPPESSTSGGLCPSGGPVILGVNWNCVAVLNLTELALVLLSIGIVAYVFRDADRAELPGDSSEVPITSDELASYRRARELGVPYRPGETSRGKEGR